MCVCVRVCGVTVGRCIYIRYVCVYVCIMCMHCECAGVEKRASCVCIHVLGVCKHALPFIMLLLCMCIRPEPLYVCMIVCAFIIIVQPLSLASFLWSKYSVVNL